MQSFFANLTVSQVWGWIMAVFVAVVSIDKGIDVFKKWHKASPDGQQNEKIAEMDKRLVVVEQAIIRHGELFRNDKMRLEAIEESNRVTQEALLALLSHAIDGNDVGRCVKAKDALEKYLIQK